MSPANPNDSAGHSFNTTGLEHRKYCWPVLNSVLFARGDTYIDTHIYTSVVSYSPVDNPVEMVYYRVLRVERAEQCVCFASPTNQRSLTHFRPDPWQFHRPRSDKWPVSITVVMPKLSVTRLIKKIPRILCYLKFHYVAHKQPPLATNFKHIDLAQNSPSFLSTVHCHQNDAVRLQ